jgi:hypothetical protein
MTDTDPDWYARYRREVEAAHEEARKLFNRAYEEMGLEWMIENATHDKWGIWTLPEWGEK